MLYELNNVMREYKGRVALNIPHLEIEAGKIYTLIGPNGAGKTTLLNILAFLDQASSGELRFVGERVAYSAKQLLALRRRVVLLDQYPILFTGPVWKNVEFGLKIRGMGKAERQQRVHDVLDLVGMKSFVEADAHKLSGGESKRVALARALALRPEVLLCDEPGANVDKENQEIILSILSRINGTEKTSVIFSTHYLAQGRRLADHTLMLEHGMLSTMVNENIYRGLVIKRHNGRTECQLAGRFLLSLPTEMIEGNIKDFKLQIDPEGIVYAPEYDDSMDNNNIVTGHVEQINQDRGRVLIGLDIGIKLFFFLPMAEYLKQPPVIGSKVTVALPDSSFRCTSM
jgi:tungstate transport system ATP-binding protein